jgi:hypothetical protein
VSVKEKALLKCQVSNTELNASEPLMKCRNAMEVMLKPRVCGSLGIRIWKATSIYCPDNIRHKGGRNVLQAVWCDVGTCRFDDKGKIQVEEPQG